MEGFLHIVTVGLFFIYFRIAYCSLGVILAGGQILERPSNFFFFYLQKARLIAV